MDAKLYLAVTPEDRNILGFRYRFIDADRLRIRYMCGAKGPGPLLLISPWLESPLAFCRFANFPNVEFEGGQVIAASSISSMFSIVKGWPHSRLHGRMKQLFSRLNSAAVRRSWHGRGERELDARTTLRAI